jgi:hypothetical protein
MTRTWFRSDALPLTNQARVAEATVFENGMPGNMGMTAFAVFEEVIASQGTIKPARPSQTKQRAHLVLKGKRAIEQHFPSYCRE